MTVVNGISVVGNKEIEKTLKSEGLNSKTDETFLGKESVSDDENMDIDVDVASITGEQTDKKPFSKKLKTAFQTLVFKMGGLTKFMGFSTAAELLELSMMSSEKREKKVISDGGQVLSPEKTKELLAKFNLHEGDNGHTRPEQMKHSSVIFGENSKLAKLTQDNSVLKDIVNDWFKNGAKENEVLNFNTANSGNFDLRLGLGFTNIVGLHTTEDGYAEGYVEDFYDYDVDYATGKTENEGLFKKAKTNTVRLLDNMAVDLQDEGVIQNYRVLIPIRVKLDTVTPEETPNA